MSCTVFAGNPISLCFSGWIYAMIWIQSDFAIYPLLLIILRWSAHVLHAPLSRAAVGKRNRMHSEPTCAVAWLRPRAAPTCASVIVRLGHFGRGESGRQLEIYFCGAPTGFPPLFEEPRRRGKAPALWEAIIVSISSSEVARIECFS